MTEQQAKEAAETFRRCGWDVWAAPSRIRGWELLGKAADGDSRPCFGFSHNDMRVLVLGGRIAKL